MSPQKSDKRHWTVLWEKGFILRSVSLDWPPTNDREQERPNPNANKANGGLDMRIKAVTVR